MATYDDAIEEVAQSLKMMPDRPMVQFGLTIDPPDE
jgi:hypothetical protein